MILHKLHKQKNHLNNIIQRDEKGYDIWNGEFTDTKTKKDFNYSVALTELEEEVGIKIEYLKE